MNERFDIDRYILTDYYVYVGNAENYLVGLYYQTGEKYHCTQLKNELLLTIYQLWCIKYNKTGLMPSDKYKLQIKLNKRRFSLGTTLTSLDIIPGQIKENKEMINDEFSGSKNVPYFYRETEDYINDEAKDLLIKIFRRFGNWSIKDLKTESQFIINNILSVESNPEFITADLLNNKLSNLWSKPTNNEIINFIKENKPKFNNNKPVLHRSKVIVDFDSWFSSMTFDEQKIVLKTLNNLKNTLNRTKIEDDNNQKVKMIRNGRKF